MKQAVIKVGIPIILYTITYIFAHQVAFFFPNIRSFTMMIWPAGGIALAALILNPIRVWHYYIALFFVAGVAADMILAHIPFSASIGFMSANILESTLCALLFRKFCKSSLFDLTRIQELLCLIAGAFFVNAITSIIGAATSFYFSGTSFTDAWTFWYIADFLGILLITPFVVSVVRIQLFLKRITIKKVNESFAFLVFWILSCLIIFVFPVSSDFPLSPHPYMLIALLLWPAFRLHISIVSLALITLTIIAFTGDTINNIHFLEINTDESNSIFHLQVFLAFTAIIGYFFSALNTERSITEEKNRESEKRYKNLFDQNNEGLMIMSTNYIILEVNSAFAKMHGYSISELIGQHISFLDTASSEDNPANIKIIELLKNNSVTYFDVNHRHADGHIFPVRVRSSIIQIDNESFYLTFHQDITEQRKMEETLKERNQFTESLIKTSPDAIYIFDLVKKCSLYSNDAIQNILGYTADEIHSMGSSLLPELMHPDDYAEYLTTTTKKYVSLKDNEIVSSQFRLRHKDGHFRWVLTNEIVYRRFANGEPELIFGIFHNITEMKEKEQQLEENDYFFRESQRAGGIGSYKLYIKEDYWVASDGLYQIYGIDKSYACTIQSWLNLVHPDDSAMMKKYLLEEVIGKHGLFDKEYRIIRFSDKETRWVIGHGKVVFEKDGSPIYLIGTTQDITERKNSELLLQKSQKLESLGILAGGIAHDFNNLMGGIFGYIEIAMSVSRDDYIVKNLSKALSTIDRAKGLTSQLLTFAKGGAPIQKETTLVPLIQETVQFALSGSPVRSIFTIAHDLWNCNIDKNQISQVFNNIVINAVQAMPGGGEITVTAVNVVLKDQEIPSLDAGNYVRISIKDNGKGIEKENMHKLFVPFYTTKPAGLGLGLATSYSIIHRHHGTIEVYSDAGKGTIVHIYIPASAIKAENKSPVIRTHKENDFFIIMDDEEVIRDTIKDMLEKLGYQVLSTSNGLQTINVLKEIDSENEIAGILLDLTIPGGMGGIETLNEIRKFNTTIPVFVASGYADDPIMIDPSRFGFSGSICKPFRKAELSDMLGKHILTL